MHNHTKKTNNQDSSTKSPSTTIEFIKDKDIESKIDSKENTIKPESTKLDSTRESIAESSKLESKRDSKNNDEVRLDENGDGIMYEAKHNLTWWDYLIFGIFFPFSCLLAYFGLEFVLTEHHIIPIILELALLTCPILFIHDVFYKRKNRFYITTQGIGFERRKWFRIQKGFFKFGEVGMCLYLGSRKLFYTQPIAFTIYPLQTQVLSKWYGYVIKSKIKYKVVVMMVEPSIMSPKLYNEITEQSFLQDFIIQKTEAALKNQNIRIETFEHMGRFAMFGVKNEQ